MFDKLTKLSSIQPGALHDESSQVCLHADHLNVHYVPGDGLQYLEDQVVLAF